MLGSIEECFERTVEYLKTREQFGVPIGSFQALKHRAAQMFCEIELSKSVVLEALSALDDDSDQLAEMASLTKARLNDTYNLVSSEGIQMHGGIGMTDEYEIGFFIKRARVCEHTFGNSAFHRNRYGEIQDTDASEQLKTNPGLPDGFLSSKFDSTVLNPARCLHNDRSLFVTDDKQHRNDIYGDIDKKPEDASPAIPAATVILLKDTDDGIQTLMLHRTSKVHFGGMWVFPGGRIDPEDYGDDPDELIRQHAQLRHERPWKKRAYPSHQTNGLVRPLDTTRISPEVCDLVCDECEGNHDVNVDGQEIAAHEWIAPSSALEP